ncbi:putative coat protein [Acidianus rod-shaped virus 3]|uniref:Putative coat protein n=1 Tax=Acidianus rod-shaped virus 3 TaxID=2730617 RepID=A0A6M3VXR9_9VIRU|nr:putative coat protein [Acidianus rod-shaped virus 3]QJF12326.1 putative coat protein [Acidianus rod-shaped virus 3]
MENKFADWNKYRRQVNQVILEYFNETGVPLALRSLYFSFGQKILSIVKRQKDKNIIDKLVEANICYFSKGFDANERVLRDIVKIIFLMKIENKKPDEVLKEIFTDKANH